MGFIKKKCSALHRSQQAPERKSQIKKKKKIGFGNYLPNLK